MCGAGGGCAVFCPRAVARTSGGVKLAELEPKRLAVAPNGRRKRDRSEKLARKDFGRGGLTPADPCGAHDASEAGLLPQGLFFAICFGGFKGYPLNPPTEPWFCHWAEKQTFSDTIPTPCG